MKPIFKQPGRLLGVLALGLALLLPWAGSQAAHDIRGITGSTFNLYAFPFNMNLPDGSSVHMWGFGDIDAGLNATHPDDGVDEPNVASTYNLPQYPAPTLIVNQNDVVTINLTNYGVPQPVSIVVTGHPMTTVAGGSPGLVTNTSTGLTDTVAYTFTASEPGTYIYHSLNGSNPGLHAEMGL
jgi:FtsP/CotA-like multicopper oxidase with cupredoxin domain